MAPGRARRILVRELIVLENIQRHFLILRFRCQRSGVEELERRRCRVAIPLRMCPPADQLVSKVQR
jgi:hypothetical protein